ncbi:glycoside hydrolase family 32 protein [Streptococcus hillyeri]|uniref:Sucrose-6-phosphate hydrolase n=1 Tax=Streptococcus hillyeri TaxID=2282420 RepID=A0A3L9DXP4_9STRE|nr:glycoside hydrolase family 32 protein [Streptococcus hillyeri]RLY03580.1 glycoside hydrolase family 32 protein [Streptococcus hillyeri]
MTEHFTVERANAYIAAPTEALDTTFKPEKHFSAPIGWINDPNGFVYFRGEYHLFYQFYPYDSVWGPMHWGHAKSKDLVNWEHLPVALAPDQEYDKDGCFSGSAIVKDDTLWLMYTGHNVDPDGSVRQIQNMAYSTDGVTFTKIKENPVATGDILPEELVAADFRDPKLFEKDGRYYAVVAAKHKDNVGTIVLLGSDDLVDWSFESIFLKGEADQGFMWECPDYFSLGGQDVLVFSPMGYPKAGNDFANLNSSVAVLGTVDWETKTFKLESVQEIDHGHDFYAPQSLEDGQGRRIMIGWEHTWGRTVIPHELRHGWAGSMTLPRQLTIVNGRVKQTVLSESIAELPKVALGDVVESAAYLELSLEASRHFRIGSAEDFVTFGYDADREEVYIDRSKLAYQLVGEEKWETTRRAVTVKATRLQVVIDKNSLEIFVNGGQESLTSVVYLTQERYLEELK